jgi:C4-dicarboxylate-specific signal transduction histidine kinase
MTSRHIRKKFYAIYIFTLVLYIGVSVTSYLMFSANLNKTKEFEERNARDNRERVLVNDLALELGYGAFIHNFKNYILRKDDIYFEEATEHYIKMKTILDKLEEMNHSSVDYQQNIAVIRSTIDRYNEKLNDLKKMGPDSSIQSLDSAIRIDDRPAVKAIRFIQKSIQIKQKNLKGEFTNHINYMVMMLNIVSLSALTFFIFFFSFVFIKIRSLQRKSDEEKQNRIHMTRIQEIQEMSGTIAHEINNPLAVIMGSASAIKKVLTRNPIMKERALKKADLIVDTVNRISSIIQSMKNLSHKSETKTWDSFFLSDTLNDVINLSKDRFKHNQIKIMIEGNPKVPLFGQRNQIGQVILNLLNNSYDAIKNEKEKWIRIEIKQHKDIVEILVIDSGPKLSDEVIDKLMMPFFTTKELGKGTGIGLSISKTILKDHRGELSFLREEKHTTFRISLPVNDVLNKLIA